VRVKIAYTVELEEVEKEVSEIMTRALGDLDFCYQETINLQNAMDTGTNNLEESIETITIMRKKMMRADQVLEDCHAVLEGLSNVRKQLEEQKNEIQDG
jgi:SMC interacting uncharacterized protein involved in chromosome segregation